MKVTVKKSTVVKSIVTKNAAKTRNENAKRATVVTDDRLTEPKKFTVARIIDTFHTEGVDGSPAFMGENVNQAFCHKLFQHREEIAEAHTHPLASELYLTVLARRLYIWRLLGISRDKSIYERVHSKKLNVKGRIADLENLFGKKNVMLLSREAAEELTKKHKTEKASKLALFGK